MISLQPRNHTQKEWTPEQAPTPALHLNLPALPQLCQHLMYQMSEFLYQLHDLILTSSMQLPKDPPVLLRLPYLHSLFVP